jgi:two-component system phosphate regulon sensor histidine kinase PhoR
MPDTDLQKLAVLIKRERRTLLARWRRQVRELPSAKHLDTPTLNDHMPGLLDDLADAFASPSDQTISEAVVEGGPEAHGLQRVRDDFDIEEVVAEYNILRGCLHDLADENGLTLQGEPFHLVNRVLDGAIGAALNAYTDQLALEVRRRREEYLAFVAHDLRTPLNAISLAARVLESRFPGRTAPDNSDQMWKTLRRNVQRLDDLVSKVLEENANLEPEAGVKLECRRLDLWPLVESLLQDLYALAAKTETRLMNQVPHDLVVFADAGVLRRVFQNLITNALDHTPRGQVEIGARELPDEGGVECWVKDNGAGIPQELIGKIFDKGQTDGQNAQGKGLGLAIVKTYTEAAGGTVSVESQKGFGSVFRFTLPAQPNIQRR